MIIGFALARLLSVNNITVFFSYSADQSQGFVMFICSTKIGKHFEILVYSKAGLIIATCRDFLLLLD